MSKFWKNLKTECSYSLVSNVPPKVKYLVITRENRTKPVIKPAIKVLLYSISQTNLQIFCQELLEIYNSDNFSISNSFYGVKTDIQRKGE